MLLRRRGRDTSFAKPVDDVYIVYIVYIVYVVYSVYSVYIVYIVYVVYIVYIVYMVADWRAHLWLRSRCITKRNRRGGVGIGGPVIGTGRSQTVAGSALESRAPYLLAT
ncbi:MAG TPA: hypothetical protein VMN78_05170 [Longimicrobiales bacterium]|nr:hypothetical protein [Longimicrobiales bacterium]